MDAGPPVAIQRAPGAGGAPARVDGAPSEARLPGIMAKSACGPHTELSSNDAVRVTRCPCGTVHVLFLGPGVTLQLSAEALRGAAVGITAAAAQIDARLEVRAAGSTCLN